MIPSAFIGRGVQCEQRFNIMLISQISAGRNATFHNIATEGNIIPRLTPSIPDVGNIVFLGINPIEKNNVAGICYVICHPDKFKPNKNQILGYIIKPLEFDVDIMKNSTCVNRDLVTLATLIIFIQQTQNYLTV